MIASIEVPSENFEVYEENWKVVETFLRLATQWTFTQGMHVGLNYQSVDFLFRHSKIENPDEVFQGLQAMEFAALSALREKGK